MTSNLRLSPRIMDLALVPRIATTGQLALVALCALACGGGASGSSGFASNGGPLIPAPALSTVTIVTAGGAGSSLVVGQALQLTVVTRDQSGSTIAASVAWSTSSASVATVTSGGLVSATGAGSATITATATAGTATVSSTFGVTVIAVPVLTTVTVAGTTAMNVGQSSRLTATARDQNGTVMSASIAWSSTAATIAAVSGSGLVTAIAVGGATITALATVGTTSASGTASVSVFAAAPVLASVAITWGTSAPNIATITQGGLVTAVASGSVIITAQASGSGGASLSATRLIAVSAAAPVLTSVAISASSQTVTTGLTLQLTAVARDQNGATVAATLAWSSSNNARATVSSTGLVTAVSAGSVTINVTAASGALVVTNDLTLTIVSPPTLTSVVVSGPVSTVAVAATLQLAAAPKDQFGAVIGGATVTWSSNATGIATVGATTGLVTGVSAGNATMTASATIGSANVSSFMTIAVTGGFPLASTVNAVGLSFSPAIVDIAVGGTVTWNGLAGHDVTFDTGGSPANVSGASSGSRTFSVPVGTYAYHCSIHGSGMSGSVVVH